MRPAPTSTDTPIRVYARVLLVLVLAALASTTAHAQPAHAGADAGPASDSQARAHSERGAAPKRVVRVAVAGNPPFVTQADDGELSGLSMEVWKRVSDRLDLDYRVVAHTSIEDAIQRVVSGNVDVLVGPVSIRAARASQVAFTQPYFYSSLAIAAPAAGSLFDRIKPFLDTAFASFAALFVGTLLLVGTFIWLAERARNPDQFPSDPLRGVGNGVWLALVTMTTVGYGDRAPVTLRGRVLIGFWMLASMVGASSFTAFVATALTLSQIDRPALASAEQLAGRSVAVVRGTVSQRFARAHRARPVPAANIEAALSVLAEGDAEALVFDEPILRHALRQRPDMNVQLSAATYWPQGYGFAVATDSTLRERLTVELLRLQESGEIDELAKTWL